jgi:membrane associated rhomboid family serine protease
MLLPYTVDVPMIRLPIANWALIATTALVSLAVFLGLWPGADWRADRKLQQAFEQLQKKRGDSKEISKEVDDILHASWNEPVPPLALRPGAFSPFQLVSHLFVHADIGHLLGNMLFLFVFGNAVNAKLGHGLFLASYCLLGAIAGVCWLLIGDGRPAVGASGAIMGIVGMFFVLFPRNDVRFFYWYWTVSDIFDIPAFWLILFYLGCDLVGALFFGAGAVAYIAHLGGAVA